MKADTANADGNYMEGEVRVGSHNLVVGAGHTYGSNGGLLGGYNNSLFGQGSAIFLGKRSWLQGMVSHFGGDNRATGKQHPHFRHSNTASGDRASISGGLLNISAGIATSILGGQYMQTKPRQVRHQRDRQRDVKYTT